MLVCTPTEGDAVGLASCLSALLEEDMLLSMLPLPAASLKRMCALRPVPSLVTTRLPLYDVVILMTWICVRPVVNCAGQGQSSKIA